MSTKNIVRPLAVLALASAAWLPATAAHATTAASVDTSARSSSIQPFVRDWVGHTRGLDLRAGGTAVESINDGCCTRVIELRLHVSRGRGDGHHGSVLARVTEVQIFDPAAYPKGDRPHVGDTARMRVRHGVLHEPFTQAIYCTPAAGGRGVCGA